MKRKEFKVALYHVNGSDDNPISEDVAYAHNSGIRKSEALARTYARERGVLLQGGKSSRDAAGYRRNWHSADGHHEVVAVVHLAGIA